MNRILKIVFILLLVITIAELGYYVFVLSAKNNNKPTELAATLENKADIVSPKSLANESNSSIFDKLLNPSVLEFLKEYKIGNNTNQHFLVVIEQLGYISDIEYDTTNTRPVKISVVDENGSHIVNYTLNETMAFYLKENPDTPSRSMDIVDLKKGQKIKFTDQVDLFTATNRKTYFLVYEQ